MKKTLTTVGIWAAISAALGLWLGAENGWALFAIGMLIMVLISGNQHHKIEQWVRNLDDTPPASVGPWDDVLAPIYRYLKKNREETLIMSRNLDGIMMAAEALPDGALTLDHEMTIQWCNQTACHYLGLNPSTDRHQSIFNILRSPEFAHYAHNKELWDQPILLHCGQQAATSRALLLQLIPYGINRYLLTSRDVTQMEKLETTRKDFVANVSHELRTPLTVLSGFLETLRDMPCDSMSFEQRQHYEDLMLDQAKHMQAIVSDLLTLSTLESSPTADNTLVDMPQMIARTLQQVMTLSQGKHVFIEEIDESLFIEGVESELLSAVSNLLINAVRYTPTNGTITTRWQQRTNGTAIFSVEDTGIGVAPRDIPRLTERFYRTDKGRARATGGTGLGLAITRHVAVRHDAELKITSRYGVGSTFNLILPLDRVRRNVAAESESELL